MHSQVPLRKKRACLTYQIQEHENVLNRKADDVKRFKEKNQITTSGENVPKPVTTFEEAGLPSYLTE